MTLASEPATQSATRALAAFCAGLTYDQVSGDLTQANYSSLRAGKIEFRRLCEQVQYGMLIPMLVRPIAERFQKDADPSVARAATRALARLKCVDTPRP